MATIHVDVVSAEESIFSGEAKFVALPGEAGERNIFRGDGYFNIDLSVTKAWDLFADTRLRFRWDVFNVTNTPKFDVNSLTMIRDRSGFGRYNETLATCDAQAGRCMQFAFRFEF